MASQPNSEHRRARHFLRLDGDPRYLSLRPSWMPLALLVLSAAMLLLEVLDVRLAWGALASTIGSMLVAVIGVVGSARGIAGSIHGGWLDRSTGIPCLRCGRRTSADGGFRECSKCGLRVRADFARNRWSRVNIKLREFPVPKNPNPAPLIQRQFRAGLLLTISGTLAAVACFFAFILGRIEWVFLATMPGLLAIGSGEVFGRCAALLRKIDEQRCMGCGYFLRNLISVACPECGTLHDEAAGRAAEPSRAEMRWMRSLGVCVLLGVVAAAVLALALGASQEMRSASEVQVRSMPPQSGRVMNDYISQEIARRMEQAQTTLRWSIPVGSALVVLAAAFYFRWLRSAIRLRHIAEAEAQAPLSGWPES